VATTKMDPIAREIDLDSGVIEEASNHWTRYLSDMGTMYNDQDAVDSILEDEDPVIYEVYEINVPAEDGHLLQCTSIIHSGTVGDEYFMTKGHYHERRDTAEVYVCLSGHGYLLTQTEQGKSDAREMTPGTSTYIPPYWAHRTVNVGDEPFIFYGVYPGDAGHDYGSIEDFGFPELLVEENGEPKVKPNPASQL